MGSAQACNTHNKKPQCGAFMVNFFLSEFAPVLLISDAQSTINAGNMTSIGTL